MQPKACALLIILCVGSVFCFILYLDTYKFNTTFSTEFLGRIKQDLRPGMESSAMESRKKTSMKDIPSAKNRTINNTDASKSGLKQVNQTHAQVSKGMKNNGTYRLPEDLMKAGPFNFLPNYKSPCWVNTDSVKDNTELPVLCLPYFYMVGVPKAGTTDMYRRLVQHPQISSHAPKEPHWLTRKRFTLWSTLRNYQRVFFTSATREIIKHVDEKGYHNMVFGDCSASTLWDNYNLYRIASVTNLTEPPYLNSDMIYHLNPRTKIIVMIRNPVDRLYSDYLYFHHGTPQDFHDKVIGVLQVTTACFKSYSVRFCIYKASKHRRTMFDKIRLQIGIFYIYLEEYFRVFPLDQIMVIKLEDFSNNTMGYMKSLFTFLDLAPVNETKLQIIADPDKKANIRRKKDKIVGGMLPETRKLLENFYRPFNKNLVNLLGESFDYN